MKKLEERDFIRDLYDLMKGNTQYITQEMFVDLYKDYIVDYDLDDGSVRVMDESNEWRLLFQKVWCDSSECK